MGDTVVILCLLVADCVVAVGVTLVFWSAAHRALDRWRSRG